MNIRAKDWKPVTQDEPKEGERVVLYNGIRAFVGDFKPGLVAKDARYPVTHYAALELPYEPVAPDLTGIDKNPPCSQPGCGQPIHGKGLCVRHWYLLAGKK